MESNRIVFGSVVTASVLALVVACSSGTSSSTGGDGGASGNGTTSGGTSSGASGTTSGGTASKGPKICTAAISSACSDAERQAYAQCYYNACNTQLTQCYGPGYRDGTFSGPCGGYITCTNACDCGDTACRRNCVPPTTECQACLHGFDSCSTCAVPICIQVPGGSSGSSGSSGFGPSHSCTDLAACCAKIADASQKASCTKAYEGNKSSDAECDFIYPAYAPSCP